MNVRSAAAPLRGPVAAPDNAVLRAGNSDLSATRVREARRRQVTVQALRVGVGIVWLGSWELTTRLGWVDKFFFSQPSEIIQKVWYWITQGTELGPLWDQVLTTMEETVGGFV